MDTYKNDKTNRVLTIYTQLINGHLINKTQAATCFEVDERTIQRDIDDVFLIPLFMTEIKKVTDLNRYIK